MGPKFLSLILILFSGSSYFAYTYFQSQVAVDHDGFVCGVNSGDYVYCAISTPYSGTRNWQQLPGRLSQVSVHEDKIFGVNSNHNIYYGKIIYQKGKITTSWRLLNGRLNSISYDGIMVCGTNYYNKIFCANKNIETNPNWTSLPGALKQLVVRRGAIFGVNNNDDAYFGRIVDISGLKLVPGWVKLQSTSLKQISFDGRNLCGCNKNDQIFCASSGLTTRPNWKQLPGALKWVNVYNRGLYGVNKNDYIYYNELNADLTVGPWKNLNGRLKQISFSPGYFYYDVPSDLGGNLDNETFFEEGNETFFEGGNETEMLKLSME